jgi:hypothetical protein
MTDNELNAIKEQLNDGEKRALDTIRARPMLRFEHSMNIDVFNFIIIDGLKLNLERGNLGLIKAAPLTGPPKGPGIDVMGLIMGDGKPDEELKAQPAVPLGKTTVSDTETETTPLAQRGASVWSKVTAFFSKWRKPSGKSASAEAAY